MKRLFFIVGTVGCDTVMADSAREASRCSRLPGGLQHVLAVIDAAYVAGASRAIGMRFGTPLQTPGNAPFVILAGTPAATGGQGE